MKAFTPLGAGTPSVCRLAGKPNLSTQESGDVEYLETRGKSIAPGIVSALHAGVASPRRCESSSSR
eukprot:2703400-Prymnesium_polylepis.1